MAFTNLETKEINCKVLYFGPKGAGKTANFASIFQQSQTKLHQGRFELDADEQPFFEFIPISLGHLKEFHVKLHLYTLPANPLYETVHSVMLKGLDGFVFVFDSRLSSMRENLKNWLETKELLSREGYNMLTLPRVLQYNKRDHPEAVSLDVLRHELNPGGTTDIESSAINSVGTMETVHQVAQKILDQLAQP
ncbi:GTP-binding protein [Pseudobacteriovorax antillogorgiicola]|uniref:Signal recognition particle receptor subunit beta, a GTPase n=1 Tax=Pseudobacteriovorax antillogorgiicola TaxID=1513793 RepID=A0A1Y6B3X0_9BACT|nr:GTPase domain-containing protein [Pseudobacteriovorax antillogorgiicola]TCS59464.1 hypothetical protein EDD56_101378 [Pseudobacteriovorax antillogorgiicola]SME88107.1 hypothetical protein SAMN06296036_101107 [Pseudobacteriovorax antillogorgiicola]